MRIASDFPNQRERSPRASFGGPALMVLAAWGAMLLPGSAMAEQHQVQYALLPPALLHGKGMLPLPSPDADVEAVAPATTGRNFGKTQAQPRSARAAAHAGGAETGARRPLATLGSRDWLAGLGAWGRGLRAEAAEAFARVARSSSGPAALRSAFWAARAYAAAGDRKASLDWFVRAAQAPDSLYGMLALYSLDALPTFAWSAPAPMDSEIAELGQEPAVRGALALLEAGRQDQAELLLRRAAERLSPRKNGAMLALALQRGLPSLAMHCAERDVELGGERNYAGLYPVPPWQPEGGFTVDRALVYAIVRHESHFIPEVHNPSGATGLLQLMPQTARAVAPEWTIRHLAEPATNIAIGQRLILRLLTDDAIQGNLIYFAVAYAKGRGGFDRLHAPRGESGDPLFYIASLPGDVRQFVESVLADFWIYQIRLGRPPEGLGVLAAGRWPRYLPSIPAEALLQESAVTR